MPKGEKIKINKNTIEYLTLSQEDLIKAGVFDIPMAIKALKQGLLRYKEGRILFPDKIVQIFNDETQERMQCISVHYKQVWEQNHSCKNR